MRAILARWTWPAAFVACIFAAGLLSVAMGLDVNWDLRNYHYYDAYAFLTGRLGWDIAPAQIQTYHNPLLDLVFYALVQEIPSPRVIAFAMAMPAGIAAVFLLRMLAALFPPAVEGRALWIAAAFAIGVTGASGRAVIGSTMNEWQPAMLLMLSLTVIVASIAREDRASLRAIALAGIATGLATGLKLTYAVFAIGLAVATIATARSWREALKNAAVILAFLFAGFLASYGFWGAILWKEFGNPFFPYFNQVFQSPWWEPVAWFDRNFGPRTAIETVFFPFAFALQGSLVGEVAFRDWRLAALMTLAVVLAVRRAPVAGLVPRPWLFLGVFTLVAYLVWLELYAIYRYLVPLEMLSGPLIVGCALAIARTRVARVLAVAAIAMLVVGTTRPGDWGRLPFRGAYFDVGMPDIAPRALVIMGPYDPMAYAIPLVRPDARFVSPHNNFLHYSQKNLLVKQIDGLIATHPGPIYSMDLQGLDRMQDMLDHYGLERETGTCVPVRSYLDFSLMQLCRLGRRAR
ncbi:MAG TPA: hypothetical protein VKR38_17925 [Usitatibacter sp.]|nr:hypothetical protein [Usitatibacter sp.]